MKNNCKKCRHLIGRDICYFCQVTGEEVKHPRFHSVCEFFNKGNVSRPYLTIAINNIENSNQEIK